jgi:hypothetical protein
MSKGWISLFVRCLPAQKRKDEQDYENQKQYLGKDGCRTRDDPEAEDARDYGYNQKGDGVI